MDAGVPMDTAGITKPSSIPVCTGPMVTNMDAGGPVNAAGITKLSSIPVCTGPMVANVDAGGPMDAAGIQSHHRARCALMQPVRLGSTPLV